MIAVFERASLLLLLAGFSWGCGDATPSCDAADCAGSAANGASPPVGGAGGGSNEGGAPFEPEPGLRAELFADYL
ncbi:MAG: hypothetical protein JNK04_08490, partial [Myxococcales bacterium]|nr:hypothetical protein [Myxococcales bacterium]